VSPQRDHQISIVKQKDICETPKEGRNFGQSVRSVKGGKEIEDFPRGGSWNLSYLGNSDLMRLLKKAGEKGIISEAARTVSARRNEGSSGCSVYVLEIPKGGGGMKSLLVERGDCRNVKGWRGKSISLVHFGDLI